MMREVAVGSRRQTAERGDIASSKGRREGRKGREGGSRRGRRAPRVEDL